MPLSITCPGCREPLDVDDEYRTWKVRCPRCDFEFVPDDQWPTRPPPPARRRERDDEDDDFRPRRRRRRFSRAAYDRALADVASPAMALEVLGWLGIVLSLVGVSCCVFVGAAANAPGGPKNNEDAVVMIVLGVVMGALGVPYNLAMTFAGRHLRRLTSKKWAAAGGGLGVAGFALFGLFGILHTAVGVWVLVVLSKPDVTAAFEYQARHGGPPDEYDD